MTADDPNTPHFDQEGYEAPKPPPPPRPGSPADHSAMSADEERTWGLAAHLSGITSVIGPLVVLLVAGGRASFVRDQAVESLNFNITVLVAAIVSWLLIPLVVGIVLLPVVGLFWLGFTVVAAVVAGKGEPYRYPLNVRLVR